MVSFIPTFTMIGLEFICVVYVISSAADAGADADMTAGPALMTDTVMTI